jgi:hypothetical protein
MHYICYNDTKDVTLDAGSNIKGRRKSNHTEMFTRF